MLYDWKEFFPYDTPRPSQEKAINEIIHSFLTEDKPFQVLVAPTGSGKSAIALTVSRYLSKLSLQIEKPFPSEIGPKCINSFRSSCDFVSRSSFLKPSAIILVPTKILQDQYISDFKDMPDTGILKGRNNYTCGLSIYHKNEIEFKRKNGPTSKSDRKYLSLFPVSADKCQMKGKAPKCTPKYPGDKKAGEIRSNCPYTHAKNIAVRSKITILNFSTFLYHHLVGTFSTDRLLLVIDEAHKIDKSLTDFMEINFNLDKLEKRINVYLPDFVLPIIPKSTSSKETAAFLKEILIKTALLDAGTGLRVVGKSPNYTNIEKEEIRDLVQQIYSLREQANYLCDFVLEQPDNWLLSWENTFPKFKPVKPNQLIKSILTKRFSGILLMSATTNSKQLTNFLGIPPEHTNEVVTTPQISLPYRPLIFVGNSQSNMKFSNKDKALPVIGKTVAFLAKEIHKNNRGIIHTHTIANAKGLKHYIDTFHRDISSRFIWHLGGPKEKFLEKFLEKLDNNKILVSPSLAEGFDGRDNIARWQVIMKVPYPYRSDPVVKARLAEEGGDSWYTLETINHITQMYGRINRHPTDLGITYVADGGFNWLCINSLHKLNLSDSISPTFLEAINHKEKFVFLKEGNKIFPVPYLCNSPTVANWKHDLIATSTLKNLIDSY